MLRVVVLGAAAGGGVPQWNCGCRVCDSSRRERPGLRRTQTSIAVSIDDTHWFLVNASPDLRQQINDNPQLWPRPGELRHSPICGVILTNSEVDAVAGLLTLREGSPFSLFAHERVLAILQSNSIFNVLNPRNVKRIAIAIDRTFEPDLPDGSPSGLEVLPFAVPGKGAWYLEGETHPLSGDADGDTDGDTVGLRIMERASGKHLYFIAACARVTPELEQRLAGASLVLFDGTVWRDNELIEAGLGSKTGQRMGHIAMSGNDGVLTSLKNVAVAQKIFLHVNNSNPALLPDSPERAYLEESGWRVADDGLEMTL